MAIASKHVSPPQITWRLFGKQILKLLFTPACLTFFALAFTSPYWVPAGLYVLLKSCLYAPSGIWIWLTLALTAGLFLWGLGSYFGFAVRVGRARRKTLEAGVSDPAEIEESRLDARRVLTRNSWRLWAGMTALQLLIPAAVALFTWSWLQEPLSLRVVDGKKVYSTPQQELKSYLGRMERRGIFTPLDSSR